MPRQIDLIPAPIEGLRAADASDHGAFQLEAASGRLGLRAVGGGEVRLARGRYELVMPLHTAPVSEIRLELVRADGATSAMLLSSGQTEKLVLDVDEPVIALNLIVRGAAGDLVVVESSRINGVEPSLSSVALGAARGVWRLAPRSARQHLGRMLSRLPAFRRLRSAALSIDEHQVKDRPPVLGEGEAMRELEARRADFDARLAAARGASGDVSAEPAQASSDVALRDARLIAFYLPQFHRIAENDAWWGAGFTEWTNVSKSIPQFLGHHQPRLPGELGFYDLMAPDTLCRQVELARTYHVSAFCFHYYWFGGKRMLERPLDAFARDASLDMGFTLCWANENWTRRWDGADDSVLIAQQHSNDDHARVFDDMARYLEDPRAIRIGGKPLMIVYRPDIIPNVRAMVGIWRERAALRGWPGIYVAATDAFQFSEPAKFGFDGLIEFPPHGLFPPRIEKKLTWLNHNHRGAVFDYTATAEEAVARWAQRSRSKSDVFPGVMPGWDNEARRPGVGNVFHGATPAAYGRWLNAACAAAEQSLPADKRFVFVNAWNEWAEGAYLEPDRKWGRAFLEATARVMTRAH